MALHSPSLIRVPLRPATRSQVRTSRPAMLLASFVIGVFAIAALVLGAPFIEIVLRVILVATLIVGTVLCVYLTITLFKEPTK